MKKIYSFDIKYTLIVYILLYLLIRFIFNTFVINKDLYLNTYLKQIDISTIETIFNFTKRTEYIGYVLQPVAFLLKITSISYFINVVFLLMDIKVNYVNIVKIVLIAELVSFYSYIAKLAWLMFNTPNSIEEVQYFYPLAITQIYSSTQIPVYLVYPLQQLNVFEVAYWLLITYGIKTFTQKTFAQSLKITASSYGVALALWCLIIVFIQLQFS